MTKKPSLAGINKRQPNQLNTAQKQRLKQLVANPGTRSKLGSQFLSPEQRQRRDLQMRLNAPVTDGSSMTGRDLANEAAQATTVKYQPSVQALNTQLGQAQGLARDTAGWYDQYRQALQQHALGGAIAGQYAVAQQSALMGAARGLDQTQLAGQQQAATQDAALRGTQAAPQAPDASNASLVRQQLLASVGQQQAGVNQANNLYSSAQANVVAPGQKLAAQAQAAQGVKDVRQKQTDLAKEAGAYNAQYRTDRVDTERKSVLEKAAFGLDQQKAATDAAQSAQAAKSQAYDKAQNRKLAREKQQLATTKTQADLDKDAYQREHRVGPYAPKSSRGGAQGKPTHGPGSLTPQQENKQIESIQEIVSIIKSGPRNDKKRKLSDQEIRTLLLSGNNPLKKPIDRRVVNMAFDIARKGGLSNPNVKSAHELGIHANRLGRAKPKPTAGKSLTEQLMSSFGPSKPLSKTPPMPKK